MLSIINSYFTTINSPRNQSVNKTAKKSVQEHQNYIGRARMFIGWWLWWLLESFFVFPVLFSTRKKDGKHRAFNSFTVRARYLLKTCIKMCIIIPRWNFYVNQRFFPLARTGSRSCIETSVRYCLVCDDVTEYQASIHPKSHWHWSVNK